MLKITRAILLASAVPLVGLAACKEDQKNASPPRASTAGEPGVPDPMNPPGPTVGEPGVPGAPVPTFGGTVKVDPSVPINPTDSLFITLKAVKEGTPGEVVATKQVTGPTFPYTFQLSAADMLIQPKQGDSFTLDVVLDRDSDPQRLVEGELMGSVPGPIAAGTNGLEVMLVPVPGKPIDPAGAGKKAK